LEKNYHPLN